MIDYILAVLYSEINNTILVRLVFILLAFISALALMAALSLIFNGFISPFRRRLKGLDRIGDAPELGDEHNQTSALLNAFSNLVPNSKSDRDEAYNQLIIAGYRNKAHVSIFYGSKILLALILSFLGVLLSQIRPDIEPKHILLLTIVLFLIGFLLPSYFLTRMVKHRQRMIRNGFPDALDLLVVCVESGLSLTAAFQRVAEELEVSYPELADEMSLVNMEIRAGISRQDAFQHLVKRTGLQEIRGLVTNLEQSIRFGTSIAESLRIYSEEFRDKRMQLAEENAAKISTKLIFPMVTCLWPGFFIIAIGPAALKVMAAFSI